MLSFIIIIGNLKYDVISKSTIHIWFEHKIFTLLHDVSTVLTISYVFYAKKKEVIECE